MDVVLRSLDAHILTPYVYPASFEEDSLIRQTITVLCINYIGATLLYLVSASFSFHFVFDKRLMKHPKFQKNQLYIELKTSLTSLPVMNFPTSFMFLLHMRCNSRLYDGTENAWLGALSIPAEFLGVLIFTDTLIYWIHRALHHRLLYSRIHKPHHAYKVTTPFASHAFHPIDGFLQSLPYHLYGFFFPLNKYLYLVLFIFVNFWTVSIHDGDCRLPEILKPIVNGSAHHTDHHLYYNYNYGQFFTFWDRIGGSYRNPSTFYGRGPLNVVEAESGKKRSS